MINVRRIGHASFDTPDLDRQIDYYTQVNGLALVGREKGRAFLATKVGQLAIELAHGKEARCTKLSFEVAPDSDFSELRRELSREGIASEERSDSAPGTPRVLVFRDPKGTTIELFATWSYLGHNHQVVGVGPFKLGHLAFFVPDPKAIAEFYERVLGFRVSDWVEDFFVFLRCNADHHTVNFIKSPKTTMHHIAFELRDWAHIQNACDLLGQKQIPIVWGPLRLGPGHNVAAFHRDPDDQLVEFYAELDQMKDEALGYFDPRPWHRDKPQRPKVWVRDTTWIWGPPPTPDFLRARE